MFLWGHYLIDEGLSAPSNSTFKLSREPHAVTVNCHIMITAVIDLWVTLMQVRPQHYQNRDLKKKNRLWAGFEPTSYDLCDAGAVLSRLNRKSKENAQARKTLAFE